MATASARWGDGGRAAQDPAHALVLDAGLEESLAFGEETLACVEPFGLHLRMQGYRRPLAPTGFGQQGVQQGLSDTPVAPRRQHRHAADPVVRGEPAGADGLAVRVAGNHVVTQGVEGVPLEICRHPLFLDEHHVADPSQVIQRGGVVDRIHAIVGAHGASSSPSGSS